MKENLLHSDDLFRAIEELLTPAYWESVYNPAPRLTPEEYEAVSGSNTELPEPSTILDQVKTFYEENNLVAEEVVNVSSIVEKEFGIDFTKYDLVKSSIHRGTYYWIGVSTSNTLDLICYSPEERKFEVSWKVSKASLYLYLQQCVPTEVQPIFMHIDKTTINDSESLSKCLSAWLGITIERAKSIILNASEVANVEVLYSRRESAKRNNANY